MVMLWLIYKLSYIEMSKIKSFGDTKIHGRTSMLASKHDLLIVFFILLDHLKKGYVIQMLHRRM